MQSELWGNGLYRVRICSKGRIYLTGNVYGEHWIMKILGCHVWDRPSRELDWKTHPWHPCFHKGKAIRIMGNPWKFQIAGSDRNWLADRCESPSLLRYPGAAVLAFYRQSFRRKVEGGIGIETAVRNKSLPPNSIHLPSDDEWWVILWVGHALLLTSQGQLHQIHGNQR